MSYSRWQGPDRPVSNGSVVARSRLQPDVDAPTAARTALESLHGEIDDDVFERARLLTSEVVTNAVKYGGGNEVRLEIWQTDETLSVIVSDDGPGFLAVAREGTIAELDGGFGLPLIDTLATAWGNGKGADAWVWFEVAPRIASRCAAPRAIRGNGLLDIRAEDAP
jgi:anti-sigma regulatory factor (Ser/Thr protein kinase)